MHRYKLGKSEELLPILLLVIGFIILSICRYSAPLYTTGIAIPLIGLGAILTIVLHRKKLSLGPTLVWVPLLILVFSTLLANWDSGFQWKFVHLAMVASLFLMYLCGRIWGTKLLDLFVIYGVLTSISVIIWTIVFYIDRGGFGIAGPTNGIVSNSNISAGVMILAFLLCRRWSVVCYPLLASGMLLTGSHFMMLALSVSILLKLYVWLQSGIYKKPAVISLLLATVLTVTLTGLAGGLQQLYNPGEVVVEGAIVEDIADEVDVITGGRVAQAKIAIERLSLTGYGIGYVKDPNSVTHPRNQVVHNTFLLFADQTGIISAIAWLFLMCYLIWNTREYRFLFIVVFVVSLGSNYFWWPVILGPFMWYLMGVASLEISERQSNLWRFESYGKNTYKISERV